MIAHLSFAFGMANIALAPFVAHPAVAGCIAAYCLARSVAQCSAVSVVAAVFPSL